MRRGIISFEKRLGKIVKPQKRHYILNVILIIFALFMIVLISIGIQSILQNAFVVDLATWTSSLPSYWGGVLGGIISGSISFLGVALTIKYYREAARSDNRLKHMPFIHIDLKQAKNAKIEDGADEYIIEKRSRYYEVDANNAIEVDLVLENIGNGFASTLVLHLGKTMGGESYQKIIKVGKKENLQLKFYLGDAQHAFDISFSLQYVDSMTNEYIQEYTIKCKNILGYTSVADIKELISIESGYPQFIGQVHHLEH